MGPVVCASGLSRNSHDHIQDPGGADPIAHSGGILASRQPFVAAGDPVCVMVVCLPLLLSQF